MITDRNAALAPINDWLSKGWRLAVFENKDLGSRDVGLRFCLPFGDELIHAGIGEARAPDGAYGAGWRYILIAKPTTAQEAVDLVFQEPA